MRLEKKGRIELVLRAFLRWLDRRLEGIFTDALGQVILHGALMEV